MRAPRTPDLNPLDATELVSPVRIALVHELASKLSAVVEQGRPQLVSLEGDLGVGKTRLLRELYMALARSQGFWPLLLDGPTAGSAREQIDPGTFVPGSGEPMPWVWWPVKCGIVRGVPVPALSDSAALLHDRLEHAFATRRRTDALQAFLRKLAMFGIGVVPLGNLATVQEVVDAAGDLIDTTRSARRLARAHGTARRQRHREYAVPSGEESHLALVHDIVSRLVELGREGLPVILVVDDAHHCEEGLLRMLERIFGNELEMPFLCVCASTTGLADVADSRFVDWVQRASTRDPDRVTRQQIAPLPDYAVEVLVRRLAPATEHVAVAALAARADGNPLLLSGLLSNEVVEKSARNGALELSQRDIAGLPNSHREHFQQKWRALPSKVRLVLCLAALQGRVFVRQLVAEGAPAVSDADARAGPLPITETLRLRAWVCEVLPDHAFTEQLGFELAIEAITGDHRFPPAQLHDVCARIAACITNWKKDRSTWATLDPELQLLILDVHVEIQRHLQTAHLGFVDVLSAIDSALTVGRLRRLRTDARAALHVLEDAVELATTAIPDHSITGAAREHLAATLSLLHRDEEALEQRRLGLEARERALGPKHPLYVDALAELAIVLGRLRRYEEALAHHERVLAISVALFGEDSQRAITAQQWVARSLEDLARFGEALEHRRSLRDRLARLEGSDAIAALDAQEALAAVLLNLDRPEAARRLLGAALGVREQRFGQDDPGALSTRGLLGDALTALGRDAEALMQRRVVLELSSAFFGTGDAYTLAARVRVAESLDKLSDESARDEWRLAAQGYERCLTAFDGTEDSSLESAFAQVALRASLAHCCSHLDAADEAVILRRSNLEHVEALLGDDHPDTRDACQLLAEALFAGGHHEDALARFERVLRGREENLGADHGRTLNSRLWLGATLGKLERHEQALPLFEQVLEAREAALGSVHLETLDARENVGVTLFNLHRYGEALPHWEHVTAGRQSTLAPKHRLVVDASDGLAMTLYELGCHAEALPHFERVLTCREATLGSNARKTLDVAVRLGDTLVTLGRCGEALPVLERAHSGLAARAGRDHLDTLYAAYWRAAALQGLDRNREALPLLERVFAGRKAQCGCNDLKTLGAAEQLGLTLFNLGRYNDALPLFEAVAKRRENAATPSRDRHDALVDSADCCQGQTLFRLKRYDEALPPLERVVASRKARLGDDDPKTLTAVDWLGGTLFHLGRFEDALAAHRAVLASRTQRLGRADPAALEAMSWVGKSQYKLGDYGAALRLWEDLVALSSEELGPDHPKTIDGGKWLARTRDRLGTPTGPGPRSSSTAPSVVRFSSPRGSRRGRR